LGCELLLETTLREGDILFIPAAFPHTTDTAEEGSVTTSIHLTFGLDSRVWDLDYLALRQIAYKRSCSSKDVLGQTELTDNRYVGAVNQLSKEVRNDILQALPLGFLDGEEDTSIVDHVAREVERISRSIDSSVTIDESIWKEATERLQQHGREILDTHRDMYLSAIEEGRTREAEAEMSAHMDKEGGRKVLTPEQVQRLSIFRVKRHFDQIEEYIKSLRNWSCEGLRTASEGGTSALPENWAFTLPIKIGDQVGADLGGVFFPAIITSATGNSFDVQFFDGDKEFGLSRDMIKLLVPPTPAEEVDTSNMTPKQLKRWKKEQEKKGK
jgi:Cupin superfamily protein